MVKRFCDLCGKELLYEKYTTIEMLRWDGEKIVNVSKYDVCYDCEQKTRKNIGVWHNAESTYK